MGSYLSVLTSAYIEQLTQERLRHARDATTRLSNALSSYLSSCTITAMVLEGTPASTILETAAEHQVDFVVMVTEQGDARRKNAVTSK